MINDQPNPNRRDLPVPLASRSYGNATIDAPGAERFSLDSCGRVVRRRRATIFSVAAIIGILSALYAFRTRPVYRATAKIEVDADAAPLSPAGGEPAQAAGVSDAYLQTQVDILKSDALAWKTIAQFGLDENGKFVPGGKTPAGSSLADARIRRSRVLAAFERRLQVRLEPGSHIILVSFEAADPNRAEQVSNALVDHYLEYNFTARYQSARRVSKWMAKELGDLKVKVMKSQQALVNYEKQNGVADLGNRDSLNQDALAQLSQQLTAAETDLAAKRAVYDAVNRNPSAAGLLTKDPLLSRLQGRYGDLETNYAKALAQFGPTFYKVVAIRQQLDEVNRLMNQEQKREREQVEADYRASIQRVAILSRALSGQKKQVQRLDELQIPYNILKNEYQTNQQLYQKLLERLKNAEVSAGLKATNIHVLDWASYPVSPVRPKKAVDIAAGLLSGLLAGLTLAFVQEGLDTSVKRPEELEGVIGAPVLGVIPEAGKFSGEREWLARGKGARSDGVERCVLKLPNSPLAEAYRTLRTSVLRSSPSGPPQVLLFTSTQPREGKTSTCINLALSLAQLDKRVLLIDGDLRRGQVRKALRLSPPAGLSDILAGGAPPEMALTQVDEAPNLWVLPAGPRPSSPADLLSSPMMEQFMADFRQRFEFILIDSPPLLLVADPTILSPFADGIILVTSSETTALKAVSRASRILETAGEKLLGAVVNRADARHGNDYDYYRYHRDYYCVPEGANAAAFPRSRDGAQIP
ncbi:MAG TPA: polysaccharide biosynthesis tyrosine autokinase [Candidatus Dormibacteraeota bacterium]|nr:polysaccharide biosynthesis tyrosine autokinase [Candidatus Dormibacteraeota bacterium]